MLDSMRLVGYNHLMTNKRDWNNCSVINAPKTLQIKLKNKYIYKSAPYANHIPCMMVKPMKTLESHYPMIQFLKGPMRTHQEDHGNIPRKYK